MTRLNWGDARQEAFAYRGKILEGIRACKSITKIYTELQKSNGLTLGARTFRRYAKMFIDEDSNTSEQTRRTHTPLAPKASNQLTANPPTNVTRDNKVIQASLSGFEYNSDSNPDKAQSNWNGELDLNQPKAESQHE